MEKYSSINYVYKVKELRAKGKIYWNSFTKNGEICLKYYTCLNINLNKRKLPIKNGQNTRTERE